MRLPIARRNSIGNAPLELDREIGNAAPRIQPVRRDDGAGRTGGHAGAASAAVRRARLVGRQFEINVNLAEKKIRAGVAVDQIGMFADPAESRVARQGPLQHRGAVGKDTVAERSDRALNAIAQLLQPRTHQSVIVAPQSVAGNVPDVALGQGCSRIGGLRRPIIHADTDAADRARNQFRWPRTFGAMARHVFHLAVKSRSQPVDENGLHPPAGRWRRRRGR